MISINIYNQAGVFAENKDVAQLLRVDKIIPALERDEEVQLDFAHVEGTTQSFIHALISDLLRKYGPVVLDKIAFKNCNEIMELQIL